MIDLDFSEFHPLDHHLWDIRHCNKKYGGVQRHVYLVWTYRISDEIETWWQRQVGCRIGRHAPLAYWDSLKFNDGSNDPSGYLCRGCNARLNKHGLLLTRSEQS